MVSRVRLGVADIEESLQVDTSSSRYSAWKVAAADHKLICWASDCRGFVDDMNPTSPSIVSDKRLAIDMSALKQGLWRQAGEEVGDVHTSPHIPVGPTDQL